MDAHLDIFHQFLYNYTENSVENLVGEHTVYFMASDPNQLN